ncbi:ketoreductase [Obelidium mucronatum]|nr:ketoreductase [Obelidium mucronatum]
MSHTLTTLSNGIQVPKLAYGTGTKWFRRSNGSEAETGAINQELVDSLLAALRSGFTHIDTAEKVGIALAQYLKETGKPRSSVFITTKLSAPPKNVRQSIANSLKRLGPAIEGYVDLYLIHSPFWDYSSAESTLTMKQVNETKQVRAIGALQATNPSLPPTVNQIEFPRHLTSVNANVVTAAYGPLQPIAASKGTGVTGSQVLLAWGWAVGTIQVTTSSKLERLKEAVGALDVVLTPAEVSEITNAGSSVTARKFWGDKAALFDDLNQPASRIN